MIQNIQNFAVSGYHVWITFVLSAALIVFAAMQLAKWGDVIAARTKLGGMFVGVLLLAGATSMPELLTGINSIFQNQPNISAGNFLGSSAFNMLILAFMDLFSQHKRVLRTSAFKHALSGGLTVFLTTMVLFFICANPMLEEIHFQIGWVGIDSLIIIGFYIFSVYLIQKNEADDVSAEMTEEQLAEIPTLKTAILGFIFDVILLAIASPLMVASSAVISDVTGLGTSFIGSSLVALITSLPELVTSVSAVKIGAADMGIGNLFGSNMFNMFGLAICDFFYTKGRFINQIDKSFIFIGMLGVMMTAFGLVGNVAKFKRLKVIEVDSLIMIIMYLGGMYLLYLQTVG